MTDNARDVRTVAIPERFSVTVVLSVGRTKSHAVVVEGRVGKLIAWLVMHRARIERVGRGALVFNLGLGSFTPELREHFPAQVALPEDPEGGDSLAGAGPGPA